MTITSFNFFIFIAIAIFAYYLMPLNRRWLVLLSFSVIFYMLAAAPVTFLYLIFSSATVYFACRYFEKSRCVASGNKNSKKIVLILTILANLGLLAALKYNNFFIDNLNYALTIFHCDEIYPVDWTAPLGISYYTLSMISYLCNCYWGVVKAESNPLKVLLYCCYFPQIVSGPIMRFEQVSEQLFRGNGICYDRIIFGVELIVWGLFKKLVVAGRLGTLVGAIYSSPHEFSWYYIWIASFAFTFQLYADFSGAMDIIMGVSECFGIYLPKNFETPFFSRTTQEFWRRWHITLGAWLKDYIMNPILKAGSTQSLGAYFKKWFGKKSGKRFLSYFAMLFVWFAMGLWHGSGWKYVIGEGIWFWLVIVISRESSPFFDWVKNKLSVSTECFSYHLFQSVRTYIIVTIGLIFFRAVTLDESFRLIARAFDFSAKGAATLKMCGLDHTNLTICIVGILLIFFVEALQQHGSVRTMISHQNLIFRYFVYLFLIFSVIIFGEYGPGYSAGEFIYQMF